MSLNLNDAAMAGNVEEVIIRLNLGEDVNQKYYPRYKFCSPALTLPSLAGMDVFIRPLEAGSSSTLIIA
jgi:hypothetical protein